MRRALAAAGCVLGIAVLLAALDWIAWMTVEGPAAGANLRPDPVHTIVGGTLALAVAAATAFGVALLARWGFRRWAR